jgi:tetratricopeptide (TPR) repeat protein
MKHITVMLAFCIFTQVQAQTFKKQFSDAFAKKDTALQRQILEKWGKENNNDAELYTAYFNYYVSKSKSNILTLGSNPKGDEWFELTNTDTLKKEKIFLYENKTYNSELLVEAFNYINTGIQKFPARLDMRFGKIYLLGQIENYELFTNDIIEIIHYSDKIKNNWTWTDNKPLEDPQKYMLGGIQEYILQLYDTENDSLLNNMKIISETVLRYYPDNIESLSDLSIVYLLQGNYDAALTVLLKAEKINPKDAIVLNNIAQAYKLKGDKNNAIKYYELVIKYGDNDSKDFAHNQIKQLKKK